MFFLPDNIFSRAAAATAAPMLGAAAMLAAAFGMGACSAAPVKMECRELEMRIEYSDLSQDQLRFAMQELEECRGKLRAAEAKDSAFIEDTERRFTPAEE